MIGNRPAFTAAKSLIQNAVSAQQQYACQARKLPNLPSLCIEVGKAKVLISMVVFCMFPTFPTSAPRVRVGACAPARAYACTPEEKGWEGWEGWEAGVFSMAWRSQPRQEAGKRLGTQIRSAAWMM